ncbi:uncharacterized protein LAJ45_03436 [Morchella importuna]|uniref:uncharacterized protein n=1 Tax=Morchella importuna TaxID=1174673 RepID=UPI001E8ED755|nr:uncharacterized protein LAJ45_03436 [Morchella importuna]KAH8152595.1 hypothetical protein LAJ45_03436 [Morchella importuna]
MRLFKPIVSVNHLILTQLNPLRYEGANLLWEVLLLRTLLSSILGSYVTFPLLRVHWIPAQMNTEPKRKSLVL